MMRLFKDKIKIKAELASFAFMVLGAYLLFFALVHQESSFYYSVNKNKNLAAASQSQQLKYEKKVDLRQKKFVLHKKPKAKAFVVYDANSKKILAQKNSKQPMALASLTKIFTAILAKEYLGEESVSINEKALLTEGDSGLKAGTRWSAGELAKFMLFVSSNDAAEVLKDAMEKKTGKKFKTLFNELAERMRLNTAFANNPSGLDINSEMSGAYASAEDIAKAAAFAAKHYPDIFEQSTKTNYTFHDLSGNKYKVKNTNQSINKIFAPILSKTGFTNLAGGNLVNVFEIEPGHLLSIAVLGSDRKARFTDLENLYDSTVEWFSK